MNMSSEFKRKIFFIAKVKEILKKSDRLPIWERMNINGTFSQYTPTICSKLEVPIIRNMP